MKIQLFYSSKIKECYPCDNFKKWVTKYHSDIEIEMIDWVTNHEEREKMFKLTSSYTFPQIKIVDTDDAFVGWNGGTHQKLIDVMYNSTELKKLLREDEIEAIDKWYERQGLVGKYDHKTLPLDYDGLYKILRDWTLNGKKLENPYVYIDVNAVTDGCGDYRCEPDYETTLSCKTGEVGCNYPDLLHSDNKQEFLNSYAKTDNPTPGWWEHEPMIITFQKMQPVPRVSDYPQGRIKIEDGKRRALILRINEIESRLLEPAGMFSPPRSLFMHQTHKYCKVGIPVECLFSEEDQNVEMTEEEMLNG